MDPIPPKVKMHRHPPERRWRSEVTLNQGGCCCCCCCLHVVGSIVGSILLPAITPTVKPRAKELHPLKFGDQPFRAKASNAHSEHVTIRLEEVTEKLDPKFLSRSVEHNYEDTIDVRQSSRFSAVTIYWITLLGFSGLFALTYDSSVSPSVVTSTNQDVAIVFYLALHFPALQVLALIVSFYVIDLSPREDRTYQFRQLKRILIGGIAGCFVGIIVMIVIAGLGVVP